MDNSVRTNALVAVFKDRSSAESARQELLRNGFDSSQVEVGPTDELMRHVGSGNAGMSSTHHDTSGGGISGFFSRLFGTNTDEDDRSYYSHAAGRGDSAVIVHADGERERRLLPGQRATVRVIRDGPWVIDVERTMTLAACRGRGVSA